MPLIPQCRSKEVVIRHGRIITAQTVNETDKQGDNYSLASKGLQKATRAT